MSLTTTMPAVAVITLGCAKNEVDSDKMRARLLAAGCTLTEDPACADVVLLNTCAFITEATEEAIASILELAGLEKIASGQASLLVAGCLPSRYGSELSAELPEVTAFVSVQDEERIVEIVGQFSGIDLKEAPVEPRANVRHRATTSASAYLKIADGCSRHCAFCTIPAIRGPYRSVPASEIVAEADELVASGVRELVLIAQDTGLWQGDAAELSGPRNLAALLELLARRFPQVWLRVMYLQPQGVSDELLATMAAHANICNYLDIPLQHANTRILGEMNRQGSGVEYLQLLARIRQALPDVALRTTVIAGFPGESRAEARELERFIEQAEFDYVGVFPYSPEEGTVAGERTDQVPRRTRLARAQRLRDLADAIGFARTEQQVGSRQQVLVLEPDPEQVNPYPLLGRTQRQAPEVDGLVHLDRGEPAEVISARIMAACCYDLDGKVLC
ncbi:MAG: 30S ribosomal protein S12 methylthiotransferase RimO [Coriobacteriales bacterium]|jgi:ribosomal protein S12 methylthiotransferase|nr:30S ribosomal protein S12 methylthiotransferase RimO [Coriobacteriales bacterium]